MIAACSTREKTKSRAPLRGKTRDRGVDLAISERHLIGSGIKGASQSFPTRMIKKRFCRKFLRVERLR
jgi:hypothetical protein